MSKEKQAENKIAEKNELSGRILNQKEIDKIVEQYKKPGAKK